MFSSGKMPFSEIISDAIIANEDLIYMQKLFLMNLFIYPPEGNNVTIGYVAYVGNVNTKWVLCGALNFT